jgi:eukaryotic translation initiation factor 2C
MVSGLDSMLKSRLRLWATKNKGTYPENILICRDGVSEGQYEIVLDQELPLL